MKIEFNGMLSGDGESFCWLVSKEDYIRISGEDNPWDSIEYDTQYNEDKGYYECIPTSDMRRLYPDHIFQTCKYIEENGKTIPVNINKGLLKFTIEVEGME